MKPNRMNLLNWSRPAGIALTAALTAFCSTAAYAVDWAGDTSGDWNDPLNWPSDTLPLTNTGVGIQMTGVPETPTYTAKISADSTFSPSEIVIGGWWATGRLDHTAGIAATSTSGWPPGWMLVGFGAQGNATYNLADTAATGGALTGYGTGSGTMNIINTLYLGEPNGGGNGNGVATVNVNTTGALSIASEMYLGVNGWTGTVNVDKGAVTANTIGVGRAVANVDWGAGTYTIPALAAKGTLKVSGGSVTSNFRIDVGSGSGSDPGSGSIGVVTQSGGTMSANSPNFWDGGVRLGAGVIMEYFGIRTPLAGGSGTFNLNGGVLNTRFVFSEDASYTSDNGTPEVPEDDIAMTATRGTSVFNFNGGTLKPIRNQNDFWDTFMRGLTRANVRNGGAVVDTGGFNIRIDQALEHSDIEGDNAKDGGLTKNGAGELNLFGANSYTGNTKVNEGRLSINSPTLDDTADVTILAGATLNLGYFAEDTVQNLIVGGAPVAFPALYRASDANGGSGDGTPLDELTGTGKLYVTGLVASGYETWANANVGGAAANVDTDLDGVTNGVEYFLNAPAGFTGNPSVVTAGGVKTVTWTNGGNIPVEDYGTRFVVQTSPDLVHWTPVDSADPNLSNTGGSVIYSITGAGNQFVRLAVTPN